MLLVSDPLTQDSNTGWLVFHSKVLYCSPSASVPCCSHVWSIRNGRSCLQK